MNERFIKRLEEADKNDVEGDELLDKMIDIWIPPVKDKAGFEEWTRKLETPEYEQLKFSYWIRNVQPHQLEPYFTEHEIMEMFAPDYVE